MFCNSSNFIHFLLHKMTKFWGLENCSFLTHMPIKYFYKYHSKNSIILSVYFIRFGFVKNRLREKIGNMSYVNLICWMWCGENKGKELFLDIISWINQKENAYSRVFITFTSIVKNNDIPKELSSEEGFSLSCLKPALLIICLPQSLR